MKCNDVITHVTRVNAQKHAHLIKCPQFKPEEGKAFLL